MDSSNSQPDLSKTLAAIVDNGSKRNIFRRHPFLWGGGALVVAGIIAASLFSRGTHYDYTQRPLTKGTLSITVSATGTVQPTEQVDVSSELSGTVRTVLVDYNSFVAKGDVLATLDIDTILSNIESSKSKLLASRARVVQSQATLAAKKNAFERMTSLQDSRVSSVRELDVAKSEYDSAVAALDVANAEVTVSEAELQVNQTSLQKSKIISPIDGVVLSRSVDPGATVAAAFQAPILFKLAGNLKKMELQVNVDEADVGLVRPDQDATFNVDAYPDRTFPAKIVNIRFQPETVSNVVTYKAMLAVANEDLALRPGMTATANIKVNEVKDALLVPNAALRFTPPNEPAKPEAASATEQTPAVPDTKKENGSLRAVWVLRDGKPVKVDVRAGATDGRNTILLSGNIKEGDQVIISASTPPK
ncbi:efflux RND transporter periplasmic adaptor subunit (plasmid) [Phyllobacterium sp. 628]|uniref:efflux RND transporter periplasmic adaptor subunit n=1 Tax=Phyllobacterium sp. 628 TaxID=2718938 RepID=UPI0016622574|nr:efflux RND transporter periplasmic adaptor subunit [Phyllobacterium sp. 628]QND50538.1 efflux RND transporter periplasmic adaptor subunit [Phyllobacterium sp. 628]